MPNSATTTTTTTTLEMRSPVQVIKSSADYRGTIINIGGGVASTLVDDYSSVVAPPTVSLISGGVLHDHRRQHLSDCDVGKHDDEHSSPRSVASCVVVQYTQTAVSHVVNRLLADEQANG